MSKLQAQATEHGTVRPSPEACSMPAARLTARYKSAKRKHSGARSVPEQLPRHSRFGSAVYARAPRHATASCAGFSESNSAHRLFRLFRNKILAFFSLVFIEKLEDVDAKIGSAKSEYAAGRSIGTIPLALWACSSGG